MHSRQLPSTVFLVALLVLVSCYFLVCQSSLSRCLWGNNILVTRTTFHFFSATLLISPFLFFVTDIVFKKWIWFTLVWFLLSILWIATSPAYDSGFFSMMNFTKEKVSIFTSVLFVPASLLVFYLAARRERRRRVE